MKNILLRSWFIFALVTITLFTQCGKDNDIEPVAEPELIIDEEGNSSFNQNALQTTLNNLPKEDLSDGEKSSLQFMREEEKLAHDVYATLYVKWGKPIFNNIAQSEITHTAAVLVLLDKYNLTDPVGTNGVGVFNNPNLQALYDDLTTRGLMSLEDALKVGGAIEEIDIQDLENDLENIVDNEDIEFLYENLQKGSRNHLRAFVKNMLNQGISYSPQYLTPEEYEEIINSEMETGGN